MSTIPFSNVQAPEAQHIFPAMLAVVCTYYLLQTLLETKQKNLPTLIPILNHNRNNSDTTDLFTRHNCPPDIIIHIMNFLQPQSITAFACVNRASHNLLDDTNIRICNHSTSANYSVSQAVWKSLWFRDYGSVLLGLDMTRNAMMDISFCDCKTSGCSVSVRDRVREAFDRMGLCSSIRDFYFMFQQAYLNYVLAGKNTKDECFLGLHGHIFNFTKYASFHPGLSDPIILMCGRDVTDFFEDIRHSQMARKIARKLCIIVDQSCCTNGACGLVYHPQLSSRLDSEWTYQDSNTRPPPRDVREEMLGLDRILPRTTFPHGNNRRCNTLHSIQSKFMRQKISAEACAKKQIGIQMHSNNDGITISNSEGALCDVRVFYDPFQDKWKGWYTDSHWKPVFCDLPI